jgi:hypothetical protein
MAVISHTDHEVLTKLAQTAFGAIRGAVVELETGEQGNSGAQLRYFQAGEHTFVAKHATLLERRIMNVLQDQDQAVPRLAAGTVTGADSRDWMVLEFADAIPGKDNEDPVWAEKLGGALAGIHAQNMGRRPEWLKQLSTDNELSDVYCHEWQPLFHHLLQADSAFSALHREKVDKLDASWEDFKRALAREMEDTRRLTLINTDLTPSHWRQIQGKPVLIDWEQSRFGPLYLDLPNMFTDKTIGAYYQALARWGVTIPLDEFSAKFVSFSRYLGFRYMSVGLSGWPDGKNLRLGKEYWQKSGKRFFELCLEVAIHGYPPPEL